MNPSDMFHGDWRNINNMNNNQKLLPTNATTLNDSNNNGLHLSLNYNELTHIEYPKTENNSSHASCSLNTCMDQNLMRPNGNHDSLNNMFIQEHKHASPNDFQNNVHFRNQTHGNTSYQQMNINLQHQVIEYSCPNTCRNGDQLVDTSTMPDDQFCGMHGHSGGLIVENTLNNMIPNKMQEVRNSRLEHFNDLFFEQHSEDTSSFGQHSSSRSEKRSIVASSVGKKVNGRYTKLRKQLRTFGGDFTDNYFVLDIASEEKKDEKIKTGKKRKSSPTGNEFEEERFPIRKQKNRNYPVPLLDNKKTDMQSTSDESANTDTRISSSNKSISQSIPLRVLDPINNSLSSSHQTPLVLSSQNQYNDRNNYYSTNNSPKSTNPQLQEDQTDNQSVQILLSLLMNTVKQEQTCIQPTNTPNTSYSTTPPISSHVNTINNSSQISPQNNSITNSDNFSFLYMLMKQQFSK